MSYLMPTAPATFHSKFSTLKMACFYLLKFKHCSNKKKENRKKIPIQGHWLFL